MAIAQWNPNLMSNMNRGRMEDTQRKSVSDMNQAMEWGINAKKMYDYGQENTPGGFWGQATQPGVTQSYSELSGYKSLEAASAAIKGGGLTEDASKTLQESFINPAIEGAGSYDQAMGAWGDLTKTTGATEGAGFKGMLQKGAAYGKGAWDAGKAALGFGSGTAATGAGTAATTAATTATTAAGTTAAGTTAASAGAGAAGTGATAAGTGTMASIGAAALPVMAVLAVDKMAQGAIESYETLGKGVDELGVGMDSINQSREAIQGSTKYNLQNALENVKTRGGQVREKFAANAEQVINQGETIASRSNMETQDIPGMDTAEKQLVGGATSAGEALSRQRSAVKEQSAADYSTQNVGLLAQTSEMVQQQQDMEDQMDDQKFWYDMAKGWNKATKYGAVALGRDA